MKKKNYNDRGKMRKRMTSVVKALTVLFIILTIRLSYIMIVKAPDYAARAEEQWTSEVKIDAVRGKILDRNGKELAVSANVYRVDFDLQAVRKYLATKRSELSEKQIQQRTEAGIKVPVGDEGIKTTDIAPLLANILDIDASEVQDRLETKLPSGEPAGSATLRRRIEKEQADAIKSLNIKGVIVSPDTKRYYPNNNFLAHVLGSTNSDNKGLTGIELQYNSYLAGVPGIKITELDKNNNDLPYTISEFTSPVQGKDVTLTIDEKIQSFAEKAAQQAYVDNKAHAVSVLVMDPKTGEILAMVNKPDFNPNEPYSGTENFDGANNGEKLQKMWRNRLVNDTFEPGSIFKVITAITGLEEGVVNADSDFYCNGSLSVGGIHPKCWRTQGHGAQKFGDIIQNSCNVGFMELGAMIGKEKLAESISKFGFGKLSGIDLPGEAKGIVKPVDKITEADLATIAFGQTNTVNSVQYMAAFNAIANGGTLIQPHIMKEVTHVDDNGATIVDETFKPNQSTVASAEKTAELRTYLERVVTAGSGTSTFIEGYHIGGKTGTAQKVTNGVYGEGKYISSFVGMAPVDDPKVTIMITVDEPHGDFYYAGQVAAPYAKTLFTDIFNYMSNQFSTENSNQIIRDVLVPEVRGMKVEDAKKTLKDSKLDCEIDGDGGTIVSMTPYPGYSVKEGTKIKLYTTGEANYNNIAMPDVRGYSNEDANNLLESLGIKPTFDGSGMVSEQSISPGEIIPKGTTVKLTLNLDYKD